MSTIKRRGPARKNAGQLTEAVREYLIYGRLDLDGEKEEQEVENCDLRAMWQTHKNEIIKTMDKEFDRMRPWAYWQFDYKEKKDPFFYEIEQLALDGLLTDEDKIIYNSLMGELQGKLEARAEYMERLREYPGIGFGTIMNTKDLAEYDGWCQERESRGLPAR